MIFILNFSKMKGIRFMHYSNKKNLILSFSLLATTFFAVSAIAEGRPNISPDEVNTFTDMCPKEEFVDGQSTKFGHTVILVDTTSGFGPEQFTLMDRLIFNERQLISIPPYDRISILNLDGQEIQASENRYIFSKCRPRNGIDNSSYKLDHGSFWDPVSKMERNWRLFVSGLDATKEKLSIDNVGNFTQLLEQIKELSRIPDLMFDESYTSRKLIIVSDLLQYSDNLEFVNQCVNKKSCSSWSRIKKNKKNKVWIEAMKPDFGKQSIEVEIIYLNSQADPKLTIGLTDLWRDYFADIGIDNIKFEYETST